MEPWVCLKHSPVWILPEINKNPSAEMTRNAFARGLHGDPDVHSAAGASAAADAWGCPWSRHPWHSQSSVVNTSGISLWCTPCLHPGLHFHSHSAGLSDCVASEGLTVTPWV